jgi:hypothetical protein
MLSFGATMNCIPWVYVPEILPLHVRAKGSAVGISANWLWNFFVVMITPTLLNSLAWKGYLIFMCLNFSFVPLVVSLTIPFQYHKTLIRDNSTSVIQKLPTSVLRRSIGFSTKVTLSDLVDASPRKAGRV